MEETVTSKSNHFQCSVEGCSKDFAHRSSLSRHLVKDHSGGAGVVGKIVSCNIPECSMK